MFEDLQNPSEVLQLMMGPWNTIVGEFNEDGTLSAMRGMGDYLVREGAWRSHPMHWMTGPLICAYARLPLLRLDRADLEALWHAAAGVRRQLWHPNGCCGSGP